MTNEPLKKIMASPSFKKQAEETKKELVYEELVAAIEKMVPLAGFFQKGKPIDFSFEDILYALDKKYPERYAYQPTLGLIEFIGKRRTIPLNKRDYIRTAVYFDFGESLSWQRDHYPETIIFLHTLLCQK